jgi:hypothetical protein
MPEQNPLTSHDTKIVLWGPTGAGKDWLFRAFARELDYYNATDEDFTYELLDGRGNPVETTPPDPTPTDMPENYIYEFTRTWKINDLAHKISSHRHRINIHNNKGSDLVAFLVDPEGFEEAFEIILSARSIIIVLDTYFSRSQGSPTPAAQPQEEASPDQNYPRIALESGLTPDKYLKILTELLRILAATGGPKRRLAVCMTKLDRGKRHGEAEDLLKYIFGRKIYDLFMKYKSSFEIEVFATSAAGTILIGGEEKPNISASGAILEETRWKPINVSAPFFWIFERSENERLKADKFNRLSDYIEYPIRTY